MIASIIWNIDPVFFKFHNFEIRYYSLLFALGFVISYYILKKIYKSENTSISELDSLTIYVVIGCLLGARMVHCIFYDWAYYSKHLLEIILPFSFEPHFHFTGYQGLASHGGLIGILVSVYIYTKRAKHRNFLHILDRIAIPTGFAGACIRIGNLMNSEIYGHTTDLPFGFIFARNGDTLASHPTQIYEAIMYIITSIFLFKLYKYKNFSKAKGLLLGAFLVIVFTFRFFIEFVKENQSSFEDTMLINMGQILSLPAILLGIILIFNSLKYLKQD